MSAQERLRVEEALRRIDELVTGLSHLADPDARERARELVECILDLHGLGLARIMAMLANLPDGRAVTATLARDEQVKALLLLYGLHPDDPETRARRALSAINARLAEDGVSVALAGMTTSALRLTVSGPGDRIAAFRPEIEQAITDEVPDLDEIAIEWLDMADAAQPAAAAE